MSLSSFHKLLAVTALATVSAVGCTPFWESQSDKTPPPPQPTMVGHHTSIRWLPPSVSRFARLIDEASFRHGVDANLIAIVVLVESGGDPMATSPAGAMGLMQIMPATGRDIAARRGITTHADVRLFDPAYNIDLGAWYLARQIERFWTGHPDSTVDRAAAAYNGGPRRLAEHLDQGAPLPLETRQYQGWVGGMWRERFLPASNAYGAWWNAGGERLVTTANRSVLPVPGLPTAL